MCIYLVNMCVCVCVLGYFKENILLHFIASMISGLITTAASMPVDIAKTRFAFGICTVVSAGNNSVRYLFL